MISRSSTLRSRRALAASSLSWSNVCPVFIGLCSSFSWGLDSDSGSSSGVEMGTEVVIRLSGVDGATSSAELPPDTFRVVVEPELAERSWFTARGAFSMLALRAATMLFADWPLPPGGGRGRTGDGNDGGFLRDGTEAC